MTVPPSTMLLALRLSCDKLIELADLSQRGNMVGIEENELNDSLVVFRHPARKTRRCSMYLRKYAGFGRESERSV